MTGPAGVAGGRGRRAGARRAPAVALALALAVGAAAPVVTAGPGGAQDGGELQGAHEGYDEAVAQEAEVLAQYDAAVDRAAVLADAVVELDGQLSTVEAELAAAAAQVQAADGALVSARQRLSDTEAELVRQEEILRLQAVSSYIGAGDPDPRAASILSSADASDIGKTTVYAGVVVESQRRTVDLVVTLRAEAERLRTEAEVAQQQAAAARDAVVAHRDTVVATRDRQLAAQQEAVETARHQEALLTEIQAARNDHLRRIAELTTASDGIGMIMAERQAGQELPATTSRIFAHAVSPFRIGSPFGYRLHPVYQTYRLHRGADVTAAHGQEIRAAADGVVAIAQVRGGYGNCVVIDHGNGLSTLYAHQSRLAVTPGDEVRRGDVVGYVGSTGVSTGPHLHFEVRVYGDAVDPVPFLEPL